MSRLSASSQSSESSLISSKSSASKQGSRIQWYALCLQISWRENQHSRSGHPIISEQRCWRPTVIVSLRYPDRELDNEEVSQAITLQHYAARMSPHSVFA